MRFASETTLLPAPTLSGGREVSSAKTHSRGIDSGERGRALLRG
jgi:hypothetical protein